MTETVKSLVADIGGTNTRIGLALDHVVQKGSVTRYKNEDYATFYAVVEDYLNRTSETEISSVCVALAGPIQGTKGLLTNRNWEIDTDKLRDVAGAGFAALLNDLQAQGYAVSDLNDDNCPLVFPGANAPDASDSKLVVGIGTGFNTAPVHLINGELLVLASETGHVDLPIWNTDDLSLAAYITEKKGFSSVEEVLSGRGIETVYSWVCQEANQGSDKSAADIVKACHDGNDELANRAMAKVVQVLGRTCSNLVLTNLSLGGIYLAGGVARALVPFLDRYGFQGSFADKGRFTDLVSQCPIYLIDDDYAALSGCAGFLSGHFAPE